MSQLDQFESVFRAAVRPQYERSVPVLKRVLVVTDLHTARAKAYADRARVFLQGALGAAEVHWRVTEAEETTTVGDVLALVGSERPDLVVTYRNLHSSAWRWPFTLGDHVEVLTQATEVPILLLPRPEHAALDTGVVNTARVMAMTDHLSGDHHLIDWAATMVGHRGHLFLAHIEDADALARVLQVIAKLPELDTEVARAQIGPRLLKDAGDYIESCQAVLAEHDPELNVAPLIAEGAHLTECKALVEGYEIDLLVLNTKDADQLAMHGLAYPLAVELRGLPLLLL